MLSTVVRQSHRYLGLFLAPWLLMYALSTMAMNHHGYFIAKHGREPQPFEKERELPYAESFSAGASPREVGRQILISLDLDGAHTVNQRPNGSVVINRNDLVSPRRITYTPGDHQLLIEKQAPRANVVLERFHRRRGYATGYALDTAWAVTVDLTIAGIVGWLLSGLWIWWEMKATRVAGAVAALSGAALFLLFVFTI
ncbi:MAG: hypothetical protein RIQ93_620 [Verrucomicrobiota bacterium]|jgi:hypothetical protein